jgi:site-specific recombinase XerD
MYRAAMLMKLDDSSPVERAAVENAAKTWAGRPNGNPNLLDPRHTEREFRQITCDWLRFAGRLEPKPVTTPHQREIDAYCLYLEHERGLASASIKTALVYLTRFFKNTKRKPLKHFNVGDVEQFLSQLRERGRTRAGLCSFIHALRGFFKYGEAQGWTKSGVACQLHGPRKYRLEHLPLGPSWSDVQRLLASTETDLKADIRDRAILLLFAVYGLRAGEVERIRLEDLDCGKRTLTIPRTKQRQARLCPLIDSLADAITRYIKDVRPRTAYRELFLRLRAPHRPFRHGGLYRIVERRSRRLGITSARPGPHGLRHACATHLLAQGLTLTEIGGHLGHLTPAATTVYAKVDMPTLRVVADLDLGGLL